MAGSRPGHDGPQTGIFLAIITNIMYSSLNQKENRAVPACLDPAHPAAPAEGAHAPTEARAARLAKFRREQLIVDYLNRGVSTAEIATRIDVSEKRMRVLVREILARRMPHPPEEFVAIQVGRLNEALLVAYSAMSPSNLRAVDRVVKIVRELDRYHGFGAAAVRRRSEPGRLAAPAERPVAYGAALFCSAELALQVGEIERLEPSAVAATAPPVAPPARKFRRKRLKPLISRPGFRPPKARAWPQGARRTTRRSRRPSRRALPERRKRSRLATTSRTPRRRPRSEATMARKFRRKSLKTLNSRPERRRPRRLRRRSWRRMTMTTRSSRPPGGAPGSA